LITLQQREAVEVPLEKGTAEKERLAPLLTAARVFVLCNVQPKIACLSVIRPSLTMLQKQKQNGNFFTTALLQPPSLTILQKQN
jgi:hypothetical protein